MRTNKALLACAIAGAIAGGAFTAQAADVGVAPTKLIVVDKFAASGTAKAVFVAKDAAIAKGSGTDTATISAQLQMSYDNDANAPISGAFNAPSGGNWLVNKTTVAKYVNKTSPTGGGTKVAVIKPGNLVKLVGKNTGDSVLNILSQGGAASGDAQTAYCVSNGGESNCFCSTLPGCAWKSIAGGTGAKLVCKGGSPDPTCGGIATRCVGGAPNETVEDGEQCDDGDANDGNGCTKTCTSCGSPGAVGVVVAPLECQTAKTCKLANNGMPCSQDSDCCGTPGVGCFCSTDNIVGCDANCTLPACGNGNVSGAETCDDGNTDNFDNCPSDCIVDSCSNPSGDYTVSVHFTGSEAVAGITVFLDYPEGQVIIPGSGADASVQSAITDLPGFAFGQANDLDHALIEAVADTAAFPSGLLFNVHFESCNGATPPANAFSCTVTSAGDETLAPISGVTCSVSVS